MCVMSEGTSEQTLDWIPGKLKAHFALQSAHVRYRLQAMTQQQSSS